MQNELPYRNGFTAEQLEDEAKRSGFHPALTRALKWLVDDGHLPPNLAVINNEFGGVAIRQAMNSTNSPQTTIMVQKLIEAKDAAVRAFLDRD